MYGFGESLNLSVAGALVIQQLLLLAPDAIGDLTDERKAELRCLAA